VELTHEDIFEASANHLLPVIQVFGADEANNGVDDERVVPLGKAVTPSFERYLVNPWWASPESSAPCPVSKYMMFGPAE